MFGADMHHAATSYAKTHSFMSARRSEYIHIENPCAMYTPPHADPHCSLFFSSYIC